MEDFSEEDEHDTRKYDIIQGILHSLLSKYEDLHIPALPPINIDGGEQYRWARQHYQLYEHEIFNTPSNTGLWRF